MHRTVGLVGYFGWGNYGDELFLKVWREHLGDPFRLTVLHDLYRKPYFSRDVNDVVAGVDAIVIGGGDLVIPWRLSQLYWRSEYLQRPVYIAGVGVPTWGTPDRDVVLALRSFFQSSSIRYVSARDPESATWIERVLQPKVEVTWAPDLAFGLTLPAARRDNDQRVLTLATRHRRDVRDDFTQVRLLARKAMDMGWRVQSVVLAIDRLRRVDYKVAKQLRIRGMRIIQSDDLDILSSAIGSSDAVASMKFHGTVVATAYGIPCIALAGTDKSRNLLRVIDRSSMQAGLTDPTLPDRITADMPRLPESVSNSLRVKTTQQLAALRFAIAEDLAVTALPSAGIA